MFARYAGSVETERYFEYQTEFVHGYTVAETLFHGTATASGLLDTLESLFSQLSQTLYGLEHRSGNWSCQAPDILSRVVRRFRILAETQDPIACGWSQLLSAERIQINGRGYDGWPALQRWLLTSEDVQRVLFTGCPELCHGDLIMDDVVTLADGSGERLVDPNGDATCRTYDVSKMYLSTISFYEAFKYDFFRCELSGCDIDLELSGAAVIDTIEAIGVELPGRLRRVGLWKRLAEPDGWAVLLSNGLHNAALPMFHLLKHRVPSRALAFFAIGIVRLNQARSVLESGLSLTAEQAIETKRLRATLR